MFLLMLVAIYGIIGELSHPGAILPGVVGAIALILLLYMSAMLPVNVAGLALIVLALALFVIDIFAPTHGVLTGGGIIAFFLGALMLFNQRRAGLSVCRCLDHSGDARDGGVFHFLRQQRHPRAILAGAHRARKR